MQTFDHDVGQFPIGGSFSDHITTCKQCSAFSGNSNQLADLCLEGSRLWKNENTVVIPRGPKEIKPSAAEVKAAMRYK